MNQQEFEKVLDDRIAKIYQKLSSKSEEYSRNDDRLSSFKKAAAFMGCTMERSMLGTWSKHIVSVTEMINDSEKGIVHSYEAWDEKIGDSICYLILLDAIIKEKQNENKSNAC